MQENMIDLYHKFVEIKEKGWVSSTHNHIQGDLFERLLEKPMENFEVPDFQGIEIKTHIDTSSSYTTLFTANPKGNSFFEIERLCKYYGYPDKVIKETNILHGDVDTIQRKYIGLFYQFRLSVNRKKKRIILYVYDRKNKVIDTLSYWDFSVLEEKLYRKLRYLAYVTVKRKYVQKQVYFKYSGICFYQLTGFEQFITLIENGGIKITFTIGAFRFGKRKGQIHNHGTAFRIQQQDIEKLFTKVNI